MDGGDGRIPDSLTLGASLVRFGVAAVSFVAISLFLLLSWPRGRGLALTAVYGVLGFAILYALMSWSLSQVTAGLAVVVMAVVPLVTLVLSAAEGTERFHAHSMFGAFLVPAGITWMTFGTQHVVVPLAALGLGAHGAPSESATLPATRQSRA